MRKAILIVAAIFAPALCGCTLPDSLFWIFGEAYTEGGPSREDRERDFMSRVEASQAIAEHGTEP